MEPEPRDAARRAAGARLRLAILAAAFMAGFVRIALALHDIQVRDAAEYIGAQNEATLRRVRLPATRGRILDRNGTVLAGSRPRYCVAFYLDELRAPGTWSNTVDRVMEQVRRVGEILGREPDVGREDVWKHIRLRRPIPLVAYQDLDATGMARLAECPEPLAGVDFFVRQDRVYPFGDMACHVIGYVGRDVSPAPEPAVAAADGPGEEGAEEFDFLLPDLVGRAGAEKSFDAALRGRGGAEVLRIDAVGYKREVLPAAAPRPGADVVLTLDAGLQAAAERALGSHAGAAIAVDVRNGDVLALASAPRYDLGAFVPSLRSETWNALVGDPARPLSHRALDGVYAPGSVVKPLVALAALGAGALGPDEELPCDGVFERGGIRIRCSHRYGHGTPSIDVVRAIAVSCNPFFIETGLRTGWEKENGGLRDVFEAVGFGLRPALGIPAGTGLLPSSAWKRSRQGVRWLAGDTANASIGQGFLSATPMQIARLALALANDGVVVAPRLVLDPGDGVARTNRVVEDVLAWSERDVALVREGMVEAVHSPGGTARLLSGIPGLKVAAKTGTAEYDVRRREGERIVRERRKHAWMAGYAPADDPRYAFAVLVENADSGGSSAAPVARDLLLALFPESKATLENSEAGEVPDEPEEPEFQALENPSEEPEFPGRDDPPEEEEPGE